MTLRMVARDAELSDLLARLDAACEGTPGAVEVVGEAGIGKTLLLETFAEAARERGVRVLAGRASEFERDAPFAAIVDALAELPHGLDDDAAPAMRHVKHRAVRTLLESVAAEQPLVLAIDDLHWADGATVDLLASLVDRPPEARILLLLGHRPFQLGSPVPAAITNGAAAGRIHRISLDPLTLAGTATLLGGHYSSSDVATLHAACGGNPFLLQQLGRSGDDVASLAAAPSAPHGAPTRTAVSALLATELTPLSPAARSLLDAAAVVGDPFEVGLATTVAAHDSEARALEALDELIASDLVRSTGSPRAFAFRHPLVRQTVYEQAGAGWRLAAHHRAATALREAGAGPAALAHHVEQSAAPGDDDAIALLAAAGKQVAGRAPASAAHWLRAAWSLVPASRQLDTDATDILYGLGLSLTLSGDGLSALELDAPTLEALPADHPVRVRFELGRAMIEETLARFDASRQRLRTVAAAIGDAVTLDSLTIAMTMATLDSSLGNLDEARAQVERGLAISKKLGFPGLDAFVLPVAAWVHAVAGDAESAATTCDAAAPALSELDDAIFARYPSPIASLARAEWALGRLDAAREHASRGLVVTSNGEWPIIASQLLSVRALVDVLAGRLREALDGADAACEEADLIANNEASFWAYTARCAALEPTSQLPRAVTEGERAVRAACDQGMPGVLGIAGQTLARALLSSRLPDRAIEVVLDTHGGPALPKQSPSLRAETFALLTTAELARDDRAAAERWAAAARAVSEGRPMPLAAAFGSIAAAEVALHAGDARAAAGLAAAASEEATGIGARLLGARFSLVHGRALIELGDREAAASVLRAAERYFADAGADRLQAETVRLLRKIGRRVTRTGRGADPIGSAEELTARQLEIATLAASGQSNREIAAQLFLSLKTVETHLSAAYVKLGVRTREGLAERLQAATP